MENTMRLLDCIDPNLLQYLQNAFAESLGTTVVVTDPRGTPLTVPSKWDVGHGFPPGDSPVLADSGLFSAPEPPSAVVSIFVADACLGRLLLGNAPPAAHPDLASLVFMPMETDRGTVGFLGFERETLLDWPPEAMALFHIFSRVLAVNLDRDTDPWDIPGHPAGYGKAAPHAVTA